LIRFPGGGGMKKLYFFAFTLTIVLWVAACSDGKSTLPDDNSNIVLFQLTPSANGVEEFLEISEIKMLYQNEFCYNVTPQTISDEYGFQIFKLDQCCAGFLLYENEIYTLGEYFGGLGITSFAVADIDQNGKSELYFTYSWGSGIHRSLAGYFDTHNKEVVLFDYSYFNKDMVFVNENHSLSLYEADVDVKSFVDISLLQGEEKVGDIVFDSDKIQLITSQEANSG